jgi:diacylglycerol kinase family enzyme
LRVLLIVNSFASSVTAKDTVVVHQRLAENHDVQVVETNRRGHATRFAEDAARRGIDVVVAYGGDGTLNEVATGLATTETALAVLPGGSTNVFARTLGMPNNAIEAVELIVDALDRNDISPIGLGRANGRFFTFHTGLGYDAAVVRWVEQRAALKRYAGHPLFVLASLKTFFMDFDRKRPHFSLQFENGHTVDEGYFSVVMNTNPYTYLGNRPIDLVPSTKLETGLSVVTFKTMNPSHILRTLASALKGGGIKQKPWLDIQTNVKTLTASDARAFPYQLDGDYLGEVRDVQFEYVPNALRLVRSHPPL